MGKVESPSQDGTDDARLQLIFDNAGRVARFLLKLLDNDKKRLQVIGYITWLVLLGVPTTVVLVPLFSWEPWQVIMFYAGGTGVTAVGGLVIRRFRGKPK